MIFTSLDALAEHINASQVDPEEIVVSSGFFDPLHSGHVAYLLAAGCLGLVHVVVVNGDAPLSRKRRGGRILLPEGERAAVVDAVRWVDFVLVWQGDTVDEVLERLHPTTFAKGGDRGLDNTPEYETSKRLGIHIVTGVGGGKVQASSALLAAYAVRG